MAWSPSIRRTTGRRRSSCWRSAASADSPPPPPRTFTAPPTRCSTPSAPIRPTISASRSCLPGGRTKRVTPPTYYGSRWRAPSHLRGTLALGRLRRRDQLPLLEQREDRRGRLLRRLVLGVERELGVERRLVRIRDPGELLDLAPEGLLVEPLDVALRADLDRGLDEDLDEAVAHQLARLVAELAVGGDRGGDHRDAVAGEQVRDERDPADVGVAVLLGEPETLGEVLADHVAVEHLDPRAAVAQLGLHQVGDGRLAGARKPCEPEREASVVSHFPLPCRSRSRSEPPLGG